MISRMYVGYRKRVQFFFVAILFLFANVDGYAQLNYTRSLSQWKLFYSAKNKWIVATVPGSVQSDFIEHEIIDDPLKDPGYEGTEKISSTAYDYQSVFDCSKQDLLMECAYLDFHGIDTYADVFLNGHKILSADNMFRDWKVNVKNLLLEKNSLLVHFLNLDSVESAKMRALTYRLPEGARVFSRKAQYQYGWDFSAKLKTVGLWKSVDLIFYNEAFISDVFINTKACSSVLFEGNAEVHLSSERATSVSLLFVVQENLLSFDTIVNVRKGENTLYVPFSMSRPRLWNANGRGDAAMYSLKVSSSNSSFIRKFGCREIILHQDLDAAGSSFYFTINGKRNFVKGGNIVPPDLIPSRVNDTVYERLVLQAKIANMNMLRSWGGGYYFPDVFYDYCDRYGIMVWQDFMFACAMYPGDDAFLNTTQQEIIEQVNRLKSHPCLALFCGNNESDEGWKNWGWQNQFKYSIADSTIISNDYHRLFEVLIPAIVDSLAPSIYYHPSSPKNGWGRKQSLTEGDCHYWGVWWGFEPFANYNTKVGRFMSEFGFQGFPDLSLLNKYSAKCDTNEITFRYHQQHSRGFETINTYMKRDYPVSDSFPDYAYVSQLMQADEIEKTVLIHRMRSPYCSGTLYWQLNDSWPSISWSSIDYSLHPKLLYYRMKSAYAQVALAVDTSNGKRILNIHSEEKEIKSYLLRMTECTTNTNSVPLIVDSRIVSLFPDSVQAVNLSATTSNKSENLVYRFLLSELKDTSTIAECYLFNTMPKDLPLQKSTLFLRIVDEHTIEITSNHFSYGVYLYDDQHQNIFSENGFHLIPFEKKVISITGDPKLVKVKCLNNIAR